MKKSLLALAALSAFATAAQAQSSVTVYGLIDTSYGSTETNTVANSATETQVKSTGAGTVANGALSSSRIGFLGKEDLGGGRAAIFNVEYQLQAAVGTLDVTNPARTSTVGIEDKNLGTIEIGRQTTGIHSVIAGLNPIGGSNMVGDASYSASTRLHATEVRTNGLVYKTPVVNGLQGRIDYTWGLTSSTQVAESGSRSDNLGLSLNYANGPLKVAAGTHSTRTKNALVDAARWVCADPANGITAISTSASACATGLRTLSAGATAVTAAEDETKARVNVLAGQYKLGNFTMFALYGNRKVETEASSVFAQSGKINQSQFGLSYQATPALAVTGIYGEGKLKATDVAATRNDRDTKSYLMTAVYSLSKRTNVYAAYGYEEAVTATGNSGATIDAGDFVKTSQLQLGLRHSF